MATENVIIVGVGTIGHTIAQIFAQGGFCVYCVDVNEEILKKALQLIKASLLTLEGQSLIQGGAARKILENVRTSVGFDDIPRDVELIVEAVTEDENIKRELFNEIDQTFPSQTIIASNTSYLNIFELVQVRNPQRLIITHWFTPAHIIPVVEVVKGPQTSSKTADTIVQILKKLGKMPIVLERYIPGFIINRLQRIMGKEIFHLIDNNIVSAQDLDKAVKYSLGIRIPVIGVVQRYDFAGLGFSLMMQKNEFISREFNETPSTTLETLVKAGYMGVKTGRGFYDYGGKSQEEILKDRDIRLLKMRNVLEGLESSWGKSDEEEKSTNKK